WGCSDRDLRHSLVIMANLARNFGAVLPLPSLQYPGGVRGTIVLVELCFRDLTQDSVDQPGRRTLARPLHQLHAFVHRSMPGNPVEKQNLICAEPQRG